jgi:hypothetical protein
MKSEQVSELVWGHADRSQDAAQGALGYVLARVDVNGDCTAVWMVHHLSAARDPRDHESGVLQHPDYLRSRYRRNSARHKAANYQRSGDVERQRQFVWRPDLIEQNFKGRPKVSDGGFFRRPIAERSHARTELGGGAPNAVFILLDDVRHVNDSCHKLSIACHAC